MNSIISVMYVIDSLDFGGTEKQLYLLLKYLDKSRFQPVVVCLSPGGYWVDFIRNLDIELIELKRRSSFDIRRFISLAHLVRRKRPAVVHTWQPPGNIYGGMVAIWVKNSKTIISKRGANEFFGARRIAENIVHRRSDAAVCNSQALAEDLSKRFGSKVKPVVIHNGIEVESLSAQKSSQKLKAKLGLPPGCTIIGTVGRMEPFKNQKAIIDIVPDVLKHRPNCYFLLIGDGPMRSELESLAQKMNIQDRTFFLGFRNDILDLLNIFDIFLFPSVKDSRDGRLFGEGFPNAVMEAMLAKVPCIASMESGAGELFRDGGAGFLVRRDKKANFLNKLMILLDNPDLRREMGERGRGIIKSKFSAQAMAGQFEALYDSLLNSSLG